MIFRQGKNKSLRERLLLPALVAIFLIVLFLFIPSSTDKIVGVLESVAYTLFSEKSSLSKNITSFRVLVSSKESLLRENQDLKYKLDALAVQSTQLELISKENEQLKELWGRKVKSNLVLAGILTRPNRTPYDTFVIDGGSDVGFKKGQKVYAYGDILIGTLEYSLLHTSLVKLFSSFGNIFEATIGEDKKIPLSVSGKGGGSFEATAPKALEIKTGDAVMIPSLSKVIIGYVEKIVVDPRDPFIRILINSAVQLNSISYVEIEVSPK